MLKLRLRSFRLLEMDYNGLRLNIIHPIIKYV